MNELIGSILEERAFFRGGGPSVEHQMIQHITTRRKTSHLFILLEKTNALGPFGTAGAVTLTCQAFSTAEEVWLCRVCPCRGTRANLVWVLNHCSSRTEYST